MTERTATEPGPDERAIVFERYRSRLFGIAYRMLGSVEDAKDLTQETYLRWHQADAAEIRAPEGWLVAVITRLSIDRLRSASHERESYVGDWLPEPIATDPPSAPDRHVEMASDLSMAFLVMLERLAPEERAALLLRDVFDADYGEIARVLEKNEAAARQMVHRARTRVRSDRARFTVAPETKEQLVERFITAIRADDQDALLALVGGDAIFTWTAEVASRRCATRCTALITSFASCSASSGSTAARCDTKSPGSTESRPSRRTRAKAYSVRRRSRAMASKSSASIAC